MALDESVKTRIKELISEGTQFSRGNEHGQAKSDKHRQQCMGWIGAAANIVEIVVPRETSEYRKSVHRITSNDHGYMAPSAVGEIIEILNNLVKDAELGLVASVSDHVRAEVFDDFLDHAKEYAKNGMKNESGAIAGVVFEDTIRAIARKNSIEEPGRKLDVLITELAKADLLTATKAKRARAAADVRTKATHAQWSDFDLDDVKSTIVFTVDLISGSLEN